MGSRVLGIVIVAATIACGKNPVGPSPTGNSGEKGLFLTGPAVGGDAEGIQCPSDAPRLRAEWDSTSMPRRVIKAEWTAPAAADYLRIYVDRLGVLNTYERYAIHTFGERGETSGQFEVNHDGIYRVRAAVVTCGNHEGNHAEVIIKIDSGVPATLPPTDPEPEPEPEPTPEDPTPTPTTYRAYFRMTQGHDHARRNACHNSAGHGGILTAIYRGDYDIPGDGKSSKRPDVCEIVSTTTSAKPTGAHLFDPPGFIIIN